MVSVTTNEVDGIPPSRNQDEPWIFAYNDKFNTYDLDDSKGGKWMLFVKNSFVDEQWGKIKKSIYAGDLWQAKVSKMDRKKKNHGIMVYTLDASDVDDVISVLDHLELIEAKFPSSTIFYKTNAATTAGIYGGGGQKPWLYSSENIRSLATKKATVEPSRTPLPTTNEKEEPFDDLHHPSKDSDDEDENSFSFNDVAARAAPRPRVNLRGSVLPPTSSFKRTFEVDGPRFSLGNVVLPDEDFGLNPNNFGVPTARPRVGSHVLARPPYQKAQPSQRVTGVTISSKLKFTVEGNQVEEGRRFEDSPRISFASRQEKPIMDANLALSNPVGALQELCVSKRWPLPEYKEVSAVGPDHCKSFSVSCTISGHAEIGRAPKKKSAKTEAARKMYDHVTRSPPDQTSARAPSPELNYSAADASRIKRLLREMPLEALKDLRAAVEDEYARRVLETAPST